MKPKILCVDDDPNVLNAYKRSLRKSYHIETALGGEEALASLDEKGPFAVIVADLKMPKMDGIKLLAKVRSKAPDTVRMMLTGNADLQVAIDAVNKGNVFQFLTKPCPPETLELSLETGVRQYRLITAERELLEKTLQGSVKVLADILSMMDPASFGFGQKLRDYAQPFYTSLQIPNPWEINLAALLSQLGCLTVPPAVLEKARSEAQLSPAEDEMIQRIPLSGHNLLRHIPRLEGVAQIVLYQNKNYDGSGYPEDSVHGKDIPIGARLLRVLAGLIRQEEEKTPRKEAIEKMMQKDGFYDPDILEAVRDTFGEARPEAVVKAAEIEDLEPGQVAAANIENLEGAVILAAGSKLTPFIIEKLKNFRRLEIIKTPVYIAD